MTVRPIFDIDSALNLLDGVPTDEATMLRTTLENAALHGASAVMLSGEDWHTIVRARDHHVQQMNNVAEGD